MYGTNGGTVGFGMVRGNGERSVIPRARVKRYRPESTLGGVIFVDALKTHVGVQYQKFGLVEGEGFAEPVKMVGSVEPEGGLEDKLHIKRVEVCSTCSS